MALEPLEGRMLLSGDGVSSAGGVVSAAGQRTAVVLHLGQAGLKTSRSGRVLLDISTLASAGSDLQPGSAVVMQGGRRVPSGAVAGGHTLAWVKPSDVKVLVRGSGGSTGSFHVLASLAGDANSDGVVNASDISSIRSAVGTRAGQPGYHAALDLTGDGRVGAADVMLSRLNVGASPASITTHQATVTFTNNFGTAVNNLTFSHDYTYIVHTDTQAVTTVSQLAPGGTLTLNVEFKTGFGAPLDSWIVNFQDSQGNSYSAGDAQVIDLHSSDSGQDLYATLGSPQVQFFVATGRPTYVAYTDLAGGSVQSAGPPA